MIAQAERLGVRRARSFIDDRVEKRVSQVVEQVLAAIAKGGPDDIAG